MDGHADDDAVDAAIPSGEKLLAHLHLGYQEQRAVLRQTRDYLDRIGTVLNQLEAAVSAFRALLAEVAGAARRGPTNGAAPAPPEAIPALSPQEERVVQVLLERDNRRTPAKTIGLALGERSHDTLYKLLHNLTLRRPPVLASDHGGYVVVGALARRAAGGG
jgi:hypothetical protein